MLANRLLKTILNQYCLPFCCMKLIGLIGTHNTGPGRMTLRAISGSDNAGKFIWPRALFIVIKAAFF